MAGQIELAVVVVSTLLFQPALFGLAGAVRIEGVSVLLVEGLVLAFGRSRLGRRAGGTARPFGFACHGWALAIARAPSSSASTAPAARGLARAGFTRWGFSCRFPLVFINKVFDRFVVRHELLLVLVPRISLGRFGAGQVARPVGTRPIGDPWSVGHSWFSLARAPTPPPAPSASSASASPFSFRGGRHAASFHTTGIDIARVNVAGIDVARVHVGRERVERHFKGYSAGIDIPRVDIAGIDVARIHIARIIRLEQALGFWRRRGGRCIAACFGLRAASTATIAPTAPFAAASLAAPFASDLAPPASVRAALGCGLRAYSLGAHRLGSGGVTLLILRRGRALAPAT